MELLHEEFELVVLSTSTKQYVHFETYDGVELAIRSALAAPPGARLELRLRWNVEDFSLSKKEPLILQMKVQRCRKQRDNFFLIVGRPFNMQRELRAALEQLAAQTQERCKVLRG